MKKQKQSLTKVQIIEAIRVAAKELEKTPSRSEFKRNSGISEYHVLKYFPNWNSAVEAAGLQADYSKVRIDDGELLIDWGKLVRKMREIPTRTQYQLEGKFSTGVFERHFGPWSKIPYKFKEFAVGRPEWNDVITLLQSRPKKQQTGVQKPFTKNLQSAKSESMKVRHIKMPGMPIYGNPIDFRGLRHEPVNESGVVFLFGMVAKELGYHVEVVQSGFPDCEAKRQVDAEKWQRVRIEFEYESRNFRDHGHKPDECDVIVCWKHNWSESPLEVLELSSVINELGQSDD